MHSTAKTMNCSFNAHPAPIQATANRKKNRQGRETDDQRLDESEDVKRHGQRLCHEQRDADRRTEPRPEHAGDQEISTTAPHRCIGRDRRQRKCRQQGDAAAQDEDRQAMEDTGLADDEIAAHEHDQPEDRQDRWDKHARESTELMRRMSFAVRHDRAGAAFVRLESTRSKRNLQERPGPGNVP